MSHIAVEGACICTAVKVHAKTVSTSVGACHCNTCRNWGGGPLMSVDCGTKVTFSGEESIAVYNSSDWAERGFCKNCGTHLFYRLKQTQQYIVPLGLFADIKDVVFDHQVFIDRKPAFYTFANETKNLTGEELFAQYS